LQKAGEMPLNSLPGTELHELLGAAGLKFTPQRELVMRILRENDGHLDAEEIWRLARVQDRSVNLATVYRTLLVFKKLGLVDQRYFARDHKREHYEAAGSREHYHFTCTRCGQVIEVETERIKQARHEISETLGLSCVGACVCFEGICAECGAELHKINGGIK
jgi:Fe2+ or Zn2+ uptake regulation protein